MLNNDYFGEVEPRLGVLIKSRRRRRIESLPSKAWVRGQKPDGLRRELQDSERRPADLTASSLQCLS